MHWCLQVRVCPRPPPRRRHQGCLVVSARELYRALEGIVGVLVIDWFDRNGHSCWLKKGERRKTGSWGKGGMQKSAGQHPLAGLCNPAFQVSWSKVEGRLLGFLFS